MAWINTPKFLRSTVQCAVVVVSMNGISWGAGPQSTPAVEVEFTPSQEMPAALPALSISVSKPITSNSHDTIKREIAKNVPLEVIQERYPNRAVKVERQVAQDADGNYVNHGAWGMWDEKGKLVAAGEYRNGVREGAWTRWFNPNEGEMFNTPIYKAFQAPFVSEASFEGGKLNGTWAVYDSKKRKCTEWAFENDERHGKSVSYYPTGAKMTEVNYKNGQMDGDASEWTAEGTVERKDMFIDGRKLTTKTEFYAPGVKKFEGVFLNPPLYGATTYDWWNGKITIEPALKEAGEQRHGPWLSWYRNGQKQIEGRYSEGLPVGKFSWWHDNGQKSIEGEYITGKQNGRWIWWHPNGQKSIDGAYASGDPTSKWTWWHDDGHVTKVANLIEGHHDTLPTVQASTSGELQKETAEGPQLQTIPAEAFRPAIGEIPSLPLRR